MARANRELAGVAALLAMVLAVCLSASCSHPVAARQGLEAPDTMPNYIACQYRPEELCAPQYLDI